LINSEKEKKMAFIESGKSFNKDDNYEKMKKRMENMDNVQYTLKIPASFYKKIKVKIAQDGVTLKSILIEMLEKYIDK